MTLGASARVSQSGNSRAEALSKVGIDDRHSLTIQRARNIHRWAENESELTQRWMTLFASHLTPSALKGVAQDERFADNEAIKTAIGRGDEKPVVPAVSREKEGSVSDTPAGSLTQRLQDLKAAKDAGLITEAEFKRKREKVLAE